LPALRRDRGQVDRFFCPAYAHAIASAYAVDRACVTVAANVFVFAPINHPTGKRPTMIEAKIALSFTSPFVAHPYWPEMYQLIEITKKSGVNRAKTDANRRKALEEYLRANNMTLADFEKLEAASRRPFHLIDGEIVIPRESVMAFLVACNSTARSAFRACPPEQVWSRIIASPLRTGKTKSDGTWRRFATVNMGTGAKASNQRGLRENDYIENFTATGTLRFDEQTVDPDTLRNVIGWGGQFVGIGASRKMGKGRFDLSGFETCVIGAGHDNSQAMKVAAE
jgi:hypothetical protein